MKRGKRFAALILVIAAAASRFPGPPAQAAYHSGDVINYIQTVTGDFSIAVWPPSADYTAGPVVAQVCIWGREDIVLMDATFVSADPTEIVIGASARTVLDSISVSYDIGGFFTSVIAITYNGRTEQTGVQIHFLEQVTFSGDNNLTYVKGTSPIPVVQCQTHWRRMIVSMVTDPYYHITFNGVFVCGSVRDGDGPSSIADLNLAFDHVNTFPPGVYTIYAENPHYDGNYTYVKTAIGTITIVDPKAAAASSKSAPPVLSGAIIAGKSAMAEGDAANFSLKLTPNGAKATTIRWFSSDRSVAEVTDAGKVTAKRAGSTVISCVVTDENGAEYRTNELTLTVDKPVGATLADPKQNKLTLSAGQAAVGEAFTLTAEGHRQREEDAVEGDERYVPLRWGIGDKADFPDGNYTAEISIDRPGSFEVIAEFQLQCFRGGSWVATDRIEALSATIVIAEPAPSEPIASPVDAQNTGAASPNLFLWIGLGAAVAAAVGLAGCRAMKKKKAAAAPAGGEANAGGEQRGSEQDGGEGTAADADAQG